MLKIQGILFALTLLVAYPAIADTAARAETLAGAAKESLQPEAMNRLGLMYALGRGVPQDFSEAMQWWIKAADAGSIGALSNIATAYYAGLGVRQSYPEAAKWFHLAAAKGDADAMNVLGLMYAQGLGVTRNRPEAIKLFTQSAYLGCSAAMINLG